MRVRGRRRRVATLGVLAIYRGISLAHAAFLTAPSILLREFGLIAFRPLMTAVTLAAASWTMRVIGRGGGGLANAEGPVALIGSTLGSWLGRMFRFKPGRLRVLVPTAFPTT